MLGAFPGGAKGAPAADGAWAGVAARAEAGLGAVGGRHVAHRRQHVAA